LGPNGNQVIGSNQLGTFKLQPIDSEEQKHRVCNLNERLETWLWSILYFYIQLDHFPKTIYVVVEITNIHSLFLNNNKIFDDEL